MKGLNDEFLCTCCEEYPASPEEEEGIPLSQGSSTDYFPSRWFEPQLEPLDQMQMRTCDDMLVFNRLTSLTAYLLSSTEGDTICEIAGGEARTTRVLIRSNDKRITTGPNLNLAADIDLTDSREQQAFWE